MPNSQTSDHIDPLNILEQQLLNIPENFLYQYLEDKKNNSQLDPLSEAKQLIEIIHLYDNQLKEIKYISLSLLDDIKNQQDNQEETYNKEKEELINQLQHQHFMIGMYQNQLQHQEEKNEGLKRDLYEQEREMEICISQYRQKMTQKNEEIRQQIEDLKNEFQQQQSEKQQDKEEGQMLEILQNRLQNQYGEQLQIQGSLSEDKSEEQLSLTAQNSPPPRITFLQDFKSKNSRSKFKNSAASKSNLFKSEIDVLDALNQNLEIEMKKFEEQQSQIRKDMEMLQTQEDYNEIQYQLNRNYTSDQDNFQENSNNSQSQDNFTDQIDMEDHINNYNQQQMTKQSNFTSSDSQDNIGSYNDDDNDDSPLKESNLSNFNQFQYEYDLYKKKYYETINKEQSNNINNNNIEIDNKDEKIENKDIQVNEIGVQVDLKEKLDLNDSINLLSYKKLTERDNSSRNLQNLCTPQGKSQSVTNFYSNFKMNENDKENNNFLNTVSSNKKRQTIGRLSQFKSHENIEEFDKKSYLSTIAKPDDSLKKEILELKTNYLNSLTQFSFTFNNQQNSREQLQIIQPENSSIVFSNESPSPNQLKIYRNSIFKAQENNTNNSGKSEEQFQQQIYDFIIPSKSSQESENSQDSSNPNMEQDIVLQTQDAKKNNSSKNIKTTENQKEKQIKERNNTKKTSIQLKKQSNQNNNNNEGEKTVKNTEVIEDLDKQDEFEFQYRVSLFFKENYYSSFLVRILSKLLFLVLLFMKPVFRMIPLPLAVLGILRFVQVPAVQRYKVQKPEYVSSGQEEKDMKNKRGFRILRIFNVKSYLQFVYRRVLRRK